MDGGGAAEISLERAQSIEMLRAVPYASGEALPLAPEDSVLPPAPAKDEEEASTYSVGLTKTPMGLGINLTGDVVSEIKPDSQAARDGKIKVGDRVVAVNGEAPTAAKPCSTILQAIDNGTTVELELMSSSAASQEASASAGKHPAAPQPAASQAPSGRSRRGRDSIRASLVGMWGGAAAPQQSSSHEDKPVGGDDKPMRRMRLRDQLDLPQEVIDGTMLYLSPHYKLVPASGSPEHHVAAQSNMYLELSAQLGALGIKVVSAAETSVAEQSALFVLVLCPGEHTHSEYGHSK